MSEKPFKFKSFTVAQNKCAMKIGTDAVVLGAWTTISHSPFSILDIGSGTGVLALMLAQRTKSELIDAIEIDADAYEQCVNNFENSPWSDRLFCYHASLNEFTEEIEDTYDLIVSNPPFHNETHKSDNSQRNLARFIDAMPFEDLVKSVSKLLSKAGKFSVIIPYKDESRFIKLAREVNLYANDILRIKGTPTSDIKRSVIVFSFQNQETTTQELVIEISRHQYTQAYINLTKEFYLKM